MPDYDRISEEITQIQQQSVQTDIIDLGCGISAYKLVLQGIEEAKQGKFATPPDIDADSKIMLDN
jgi:hypothetical protein